MPKRDYYKVLDVPKTATEAEIKKAYRRLAMKYHPDRNPDDREAEESFKEAKEACEVLTDPHKRAAYDQYGHAGVEASARGGGGRGGGFSGDTFSDIFGAVFGDIFGAARPRGRSQVFPGPDLASRPRAGPGAPHPQALGESARRSRQRRPRAARGRGRGRTQRRSAGRPVCGSARARASHLRARRRAPELRGAGELRHRGARRQRRGADARG